MERLGYRPALDGLRGLSALAVITFHAWQGLVPAGWLGVDVFIAVAGLVIHRPMVSTIGHVSMWTDTRADALLVGRRDSPGSPEPLPSSRSRSSTPTRSTGGAG
jgi:hypothetical protein